MVHLTRLVHLIESRTRCYHGSSFWCTNGTATSILVPHTAGVVTALVMFENGLFILGYSVSSREKDNGNF